MTNRALRLDPATGDLVHDGKRLALIGDTEAIAQSLRTRLAFFRGEWWLDSAAGTPWFQTILGTKVSLAVVREVFRKVIVETPGVLNLLKLEISETSKKRAFLLRFSVSTDLGELSLTVETGV